MLGEKIKALRQEHHLSQEQVSELLNVSRQSISKYEQGTAFPDYEKLAILAKHFAVSFDYLLGEADSMTEEQESKVIVGNGPNRISIISQIDGKLSSYYKFQLSKVFRPTAKQPAAQLMGIESAGFWGETSHLLGWYRTIGEGQKEIAEIYRAIAQNKTTYELKYTVAVQTKGFDLRMVDEGVTKVDLL